MHRGHSTLDTEKATRLLAGGSSVRDVATACGVSTQAVYKALKAGRLDAPAGAAA